MNTGEDTQGLRKIMDLTRLISLTILIIHFYLCCYPAFKTWSWTAEITDRLLENISKTGFFTSLLKPKLASLLFLVISLVGVKGKKDEKIKFNVAVVYVLLGLNLFFASLLAFYLKSSNQLIAITYIGTTFSGYLLVIFGGGLLSRLIKNTLNSDVFNDLNETFPQELTPFVPFISLCSPS